MREHWKIIQMFLPDDLASRDVVAHIAAQIRITATDTGDFVQQIRVGIAEHHSEGWSKWPVSYLTGPPGPFPIYAQTAEGLESLMPRRKLPGRRRSGNRNGAASTRYLPVSTPQPIQRSTGGDAERHRLTNRHRYKRTADGETSCVQTGSGHSSRKAMT